MRTTEQRKIDVDKACLVLTYTKDGRELSPDHLYTVELLVNGFLNEEGYKYFEEKIYIPCKEQTYHKPFHFDVEFMTKDHEGYIYYKGIHMEHFSFHGDVEGEKKATEKLQKACIAYEAANGKPPSSWLQLNEYGY